MCKGSTVKLQWTDVHTSHFEALKHAVIGLRELVLYRPDADFFMRCDASLYGVGCVLEQRDEEGNSFPIVFFSRKLTPGQRKWSPRDKEIYAIVSALRKYATWIGNNRVTILTDHQALEGWHREHVDTPSGPSVRRGRWHKTFSCFRLKVVYLPGRDNAVADAWSRWAYPACQLGNDVCKHGSLADKLAVEELERLEHAEEQQCIHAVGCLDLQHPEQLRQFLRHLPPSDKLGCKDCDGTLNFPDSHHCNECYLVQVVTRAQARGSKASARVPVSAPPTASRLLLRSLHLFRTPTRVSSTCPPLHCACPSPVLRDFVQPNPHQRNRQMLKPRLLLKHALRLFFPPISCGMIGRVIICGIPHSRTLFRQYGRSVLTPHTRLITSKMADCLSTRVVLFLGVLRPA